MNDTLQNYLVAYDLLLTEDSGREIARQKGVYDHTGIIMGMNKYSNVKMVFHNHPTTGPAIVPLYVYEDENRSYYTSNPHDNWQNVLLRSFGQLDTQRQYDLLSNNCQHASSYSRTGSSSSSGLKATVGVALAAIILGGFLGGE